MATQLNAIGDTVYLTAEERDVSIRIGDEHARQQRSRNTPDPKYSQRKGNNICVSGFVGDLALRKRLGVSTEPLHDVTNRAKHLPRDATLQSHGMVYDDGDLRFHCVDKQTGRQVIVIFENKTFCGIERQLPLRVPASAESHDSTRRRLPFEIYVYNSLALSENETDFDEQCDALREGRTTIDGLSVLFRGCFYAENLCSKRRCDRSICDKVHAQRVPRGKGLFYFIPPEKLVPLQEVLDRFDIGVGNDYVVPDVVHLKTLSQEISVGLHNSIVNVPTDLAIKFPVQPDDLDATRYNPVCVQQIS